ncbi:MAG: hypothetical protein QF662_08020, partial [Phycisphaerae bacterium]|nr:hypothetical protein [Phycisphaerae bacterium]
MSADTTEIVLENENIRAAFDGKTGALAGLTSKKTGWVIHRRSKLALSFRMQVPLPEQRANHVYGQTQAATSIEVDEDNSRIIFTWKDIESIHGGTLDIIFKGIVTLTDDGLAYEAEVENRSPYVIESVTWPCIGDLSIPHGAEKLERANIIYSQMKRGPLFPTFTSDMGYYGVDYPIQVVKTPETPFVLTETGTEGLYTGYHDTTAEHMVSFTWELKPGFLYSENCQT